MTPAGHKERTRLAVTRCVSQSFWHSAAVLEDALGFPARDPPRASRAPGRSAAAGLRDRGTGKARAEDRTDLLN